MLFFLRLIPVAGSCYDNGGCVATGRGLAMLFQCSQCGYQGEVDALNPERRVRCPQCLGILQAQPSGAFVLLTGEEQTNLCLSPQPAPGDSPDDILAAAQEAMDIFTGKGLGDELGHLVGKTLGGYHFLRLLGAGGMGAVFLARQISLDREVALKVLPERFAENPEALTRFTREALSAAQLNHPNIVQVYDVGSAAKFHFISMEFVRGQSLGDMVRADGAMPIDIAAGYVLQVARGLQYAHARGIIHRDIKPDNLLLNELGVVKIGDMGLAKMSGYFEKRMREAESLAEWKNVSAHITQVSRGMGTPAYMAPEQAQDASTAGAAADQYALGCTLYYLCTGKPPYSGQTAQEVITKHRSEAVPMLENASPLLMDILQRMMCKKPEERYAGMSEVISALEGFLGIEGDKGTSSARERHLAILDAAYKAYYDKVFIKVRTVVGYGFVVSTLIAFVAAIVDRSFESVGEVMGLVTLTPLLLFAMNGMITKAYLFRRVRSLFFGMGLKNWSLTLAGGALFLAVLYMLGWLEGWGECAVVALGLAAVTEFGILRPLRKTRALPLEQVRLALRDLRLHGLSEEALHDFIYRCFTGVDWEEIFEDLFGYEAMVQARSKWAVAGWTMPRRTFGAWRDPIARWLDEFEAMRKTDGGRLALARVEARRLKATGLSAREANKQAQQEADQFLQAQRESFPQIRYSAVETASDKKQQIPEQLIGDAVLHRSFPSWFGTLDSLSHWMVLPLALLLMVGGWDSVPFFPPLSESFPDWVLKWLSAYRGWGMGGTPYAFAIGVVLFITGMSEGIGARMLVFGGSALLVFAKPLTHMVSQPQFSLRSALSIGGVLVVLGIVFFLLRKFTRR
ncbi:TPA: hypothetical protein DDW35_11560 [Candidatus Sumerlaeota bacterium]|nr:hypothetical protein [Candidatus Sumerlaeota bacterium]